MIWRGFDVICVCVSFNRSLATTNENAHRSHVIVCTIVPELSVITPIVALSPFCFGMMFVPTSRNVFSDDFTISTASSI